MSTRFDIQTPLDQLTKHVERHNYAGYDPYDALRSPFLAALTRHSKWLRIGCTQLLRRCPVNVRPALGISQSHNPKAIGLFLWGYSKIYAANPCSQVLQKIDKLLDLLASLQSDGYHGNSWGYNFPWQSRTFLRPQGTPTVVNSAFIGHALLDCYLHTGKERALQMAIPIKDFILSDLHRTRDGDTICLSYTPVDTAVVHNANLLGASLLVRLEKYCSDERIPEVALAALAYSLRRQHDSGAWFYADTPCQQWIDSFHTGFNLQALRYFVDAGFSSDVAPALDRGIKYYATHFFLEDGTPKYYHDRVYPIDIHAPTQAIVFFASMGSEYTSLTDRVLSWTLSNLYDGHGRFYFRKYPAFTNKICYMRWNQAWAFHAITEYALHANRVPHEFTNKVGSGCSDPRHSGQPVVIVSTRD